MNPTDKLTDQQKKVFKQFNEVITNSGLKTVDIKFILQVHLDWCNQHLGIEPPERQVIKDTNKPKSNNNETSFNE